MLNPFVLLFKKSPTEIVDIRAIPQPKPHTEPTTNTDRITEYDLWYVLDDIARALDRELSTDNLPTYPIQSEGGIQKMALLHESAVHTLTRPKEMTNYERKNPFNPEADLDELLYVFQSIRPAYYNNLNEFSGVIGMPKRHLSPVYEDANQEGVTAYVKGKWRTDNPYPQDDLKHVSWANGWLRAYQDNRYKPEA
jgi:ribosome modulation factor